MQHSENLTHFTILFCRLLFLSSLESTEVEREVFVEEELQVFELEWLLLESTVSLFSMVFGVSSSFSLVCVSTTLRVGLTWATFTWRK